MKLQAASGFAGVERLNSGAMLSMYAAQIGFRQVSFHGVSGTYPAALSPVVVLLEVFQ